jgi:hypothetical protein
MQKKKLQDFVLKKNIIQEENKFSAITCQKPPRPQKNILKKKKLKK